MSETIDYFEGLHPIFRDCCDPDTARYDLSRPWLADGYVIATNGRILVRRPAGAEGPFTAKYAPATDKRYPEITATFIAENCGEIGDPIDLPDIDRSVFMEDCVECSGSGKVTCYYKHEHTCPDCNGTGKCLRYESFPVNGVSIAIPILDLLLRHGITQIQPSKDHRKAFRFAIPAWDIEGIAMPMTTDPI